MHLSVRNSGLSIILAERYPYGMKKPLDTSLPKEFRRRAEMALPGRISRVVLFGSRARGDAEPDSDWDFAVFLTDNPNSKDRRALVDAAYDLIVESGQFVQPVAFSENKANSKLLLLQRIAEEGLPV